jgi:hypothetical protein
MMANRGLDGRMAGFPSHRACPDQAVAAPGRPALGFLGAQTFKVVWTLRISYLPFGGVLLPPLEMD